jgi:hypothetical protein
MTTTGDWNCNDCINCRDGRCISIGTEASLVPYPCFWFEKEVPFTGAAALPSGTCVNPPHGDWVEGPARLGEVEVEKGFEFCTSARDPQFWVVRPVSPHNPTGNGREARWDRHVDNIRCDLDLGPVLEALEEHVKPTSTRGDLGKIVRLQSDVLVTQESSTKLAAGPGWSIWAVEEDGDQTGLFYLLVDKPLITAIGLWNHVGKNSSGWAWRLQLEKYCCTDCCWMPLAVASNYRGGCPKED